MGIRQSLFLTSRSLGFKLTTSRLKSILVPQSAMVLLWWAYERKRKEEIEKNFDKVGELKRLGGVCYDFEVEDEH